MKRNNHSNRNLLPALLWILILLLACPAAASDTVSDSASDTSSENTTESASDTLSEDTTEFASNTKEIDSLWDACDYLRERMDAGDSEISLKVTNCERWSDEDLEDCLLDTVETMTVSGTQYRFERSEDLSVFFYVAPIYRDCLRMKWAYESGDWSALSDEEQTCLNLAIDAENATSLYTGTILEQEIAIHDWLCENITYQTYDDLTSDAFQRVTTVCGALLDGEANCQGYSGAFYLICSIAGMEVGNLSGWFADYEDRQHMWNYVVIDQNKVMVDVTFDDLDSGLQELAQTYAYFNIGYDRLPTDTYNWWDPMMGADSIAQTTDLNLTCYSGNPGAYFSTLSEGAYFCYNQMQNGDPTSYCQIAGEYTNDEIDSAVQQAATYYPNHWSYTFYRTLNAGDTYLSLIWTEY